MNMNTIRDASIRLRETGCVLPNHLNAGRPRARRTAEFIENVLNVVQDDPSSSTRAIARLFATNHVAVNRVLREENYHAYHLTPVQQLENRDYELRRRYCRRLLRNYEINPAYLDRILWTDESLFTKMGMFNCHNYHQYAQENPHAKRTKSSQYRWTINVWAGIIGEQLIGPFILPGIVRGANYLEFLENDLPPLLEDVPLETRRRMIYQHDGAPPHWNRMVLDFMNENYPNRWIGRFGPIAWPARSPDLTPLDFFLWGFIKEQVYRTPVNTQNELMRRLLDAFTLVTPDMLARSRNDIIRRARLCIEARGDHFEHL